MSTKTSKRQHGPVNLVEGGSSDSKALSAGELLFETLLTEHMWLREKAETEQQITDKIYGKNSTRKSSVREAITNLVQNGSLERTTSGVLRKTLSKDHLAELYSSRLRIELMAVKNLISFSDGKRDAVGHKLELIIKKQSEVSADKNYADWLNLGMEFHRTMIDLAEFPISASKAKNDMIQIRVGSLIEIDSSEIREGATKDHKNYIRFIIEGADMPDKPTDDKGNELEWHQFICHHMRVSYKTSFPLASEDVRQAARLEKSWDAIVEMATCDPR